MDALHHHLQRRLQHIMQAGRQILLQCLVHGPLLQSASQRPPTFACALQRNVCELYWHCLARTSCLVGLFITTGTANCKTPTQAKGLMLTHCLMPAPPLQSNHTPHYLYACMHVCMYICMYVCICMHMYAAVYAALCTVCTVRAADCVGHADIAFCKRALSVVLLPLQLLHAPWSH